MMRKNNRRLALITTLMALVGLLVSLTATAQPRHRRGPGPGAGSGVVGENVDHTQRGPGSMIQHMERLLELTEDQVAALTSIIENHRADGGSDREVHRQNAEALKAALEADNPNPTTVGELMIEGKALRAEAQEQRQQFMGEIESVLTTEQQATWEGFQAGRRGGRDAGGRGQRGPRGPRGPRGGAGGEARG